MKPRIFHIWDFPDTTRVKLKDQEIFLRKLALKEGSLVSLSQKIGLPKHAVTSWIRYDLFIPLIELKKLVHHFNLDKEEIEMRILAYKGANTSNSIINPQLPIKESPEIFEIITHLIGDGCVNKNGIPMYVNSNMALRKNFTQLLQIFGEIPINEYQMKHNGCYTITCSKIIPDFLRKIYNLNFYSCSASLPEEIFYLPKEFQIGVLRAIIDDEGTIKDSRITISMKNMKIISQLRDLVQKVFGENSVGKISSTKDGCYLFGINARELKNVSSNILLIHPKKKEQILCCLERQKSKLRLNKTIRKREILELLKTKSYLSYDLSNVLLINTSNVNIYLKELQNESLITNLKEGYGFRWYITPIGQKNLKTLGGF